MKRFKMSHLMIIVVLRHCFVVYGGTNYLFVTEVEIPAVSIGSLNGDGIEHLARDDLLEESDSSSSHNKSSQVNYYN